MLFAYALIGLFLFAIACWQYALRKKSDKELNKTKEKVHNLEHKIQTILNNAPIVFSAINTKGVFHVSEGKGLEKLGRKSNQSVGLSIFEMHNQNPVILDAVRRALNGEFVSTNFVLKDISYDLFMGPEKNAQGEIIGASMLSVDITDRIKVESEKQNLAAREQAAIETSKLKSEFLATMSHEIRTPINGVIGMTSLLLDTDLTAQQKEFAEAIKLSGASLLTVINDILDFSKIESGKLDFEEINFNLPELIQHTTKSLSLIANQKDIKFESHLESDVYNWVIGDPSRFRQVLNNLISNAIKFTQNGHVILRVRTVKELAQPKVYVEVEDTGIGIPADMTNRMFVAFTQGEASMSRRFGGTGLGLSICKQLVEKMGGEIGVSSIEGKGSTFWFTTSFKEGKMPVIEDHSSEISSLPTVSNLQDNAPHILVAEDNQVNQIIAINMLKKMGYSSTIVQNGIEAIVALENNRFDLVLMDCQMPKMDGLEATRQFRSNGSELNRGVPIIAMTANAMKGDKEKCLAVGMDDYISKPISYEAVKTVLARWMEIQDKRNRLIS